MHLNKSCYAAVCGNYELDQIYQTQFFFSKDKLDEFVREKSKIQKEIPDLIIHAGDIGAQSVVDDLESISRLVAVNGNCDWNSFKLLNGYTEQFQYFEYQGIKIALTHTPYDLEILSKNKNANLYVHGHTHEPYIEERSKNNIWICPGSASMGRYGSPNSIAAVYIKEGKILSADLIEV